MNFGERLSLYIAEIGCSAKELAEMSGISTSAISRYRSGERTPPIDGPNLDALASGLAFLSCRDAEEGPQAQRVEEVRLDILSELNSAIGGIDTSYPSFLANLNTLVSSLPLSKAALAEALGFDPSHVSRILAGQRKPSNMRSFVEGSSEFIAASQSDGESLALLANIVGVDEAEISDPSKRAAIVASWLGSDKALSHDFAIAFLERVERFDDADCARVLAGDPAVFSGGPYSDGQKRKLADAVERLRTEPHVDVIHATEKPLHEIIHELEGWVPLHMTEKVTSYYVDQPRCDQAVLREEEGNLPGNAKLLLRGFRRDSGDLLVNYFYRNLEEPGDLRIVMSTLPVETISNGLLERMLRSGGLADDALAEALDFVEVRKRLFEQKLARDSVSIEVPNYQSSECDKLPASLIPPGLRLDENVRYTKEQYLEHLELTRAYARRHPSFKLAICKEPRFRGIQIAVKENRYAVVSKSTSPAAHLLVEHPGFVDALASVIRQH